MHWLRGRKAAGKTVPGVYLCWELMVGNSNCRWYWGTKDGASEPAIPWCGLVGLYRGGRCDAQRRFRECGPCPACQRLVLVTTR
jgi:hypothetical protein